VEARHTRELVTRDEELARAQHYIETELADLAARQAAVEQAAPPIRAQLAEARAALRDLSLSDARYQQLKRVRETVVCRLAGSRMVGLVGLVGSHTQHTITSSSTAAGDGVAESVPPLSYWLLLNATCCTPLRPTAPHCRCRRTRCRWLMQCGLQCMRQQRHSLQSVSSSACQQQLLVKQRTVPSLRQQGSPGKMPAWLQRWCACVCMQQALRQVVCVCAELCKCACLILCMHDVRSMQHNVGLLCAHRHIVMHNKAGWCHTMTLHLHEYTTPRLMQRQR
jgi:hypothetical protein